MPEQLPHRTADRWARPPSDGKTPNTLTEHAQTVAARALSDTPTNVSLSDGTPVAELLGALAWTHDFGKATTWFQEKIGNEHVASVPRPMNRVSSHSPIGAPFTWWVCSQAGISTYATTVATIAVARHHGTIPDFNTYLQDTLLDKDERWDLATTQAENIAAHAPFVAETLLNAAIRELGVRPAQNSNATAIPDFSEFVAALKDGTIRSEMESAVYNATGTRINRSFTENAIYSDVLQTWGGLKAADVLAAAGDRDRTPRRRAHSTAVPVLIEQFESASEGSLEAELNDAREHAREKVVEKAETIPPEPGLYSITLPTGTGKTLTGTQAALRFRERAGDDAPLIYALPYTSIIDQTASVYKDLFEASVPTDQIAVHHHLAQTGAEADDVSSERALSRLARDAWTADITLTTFVQLWESLAGPAENQAPKLPSLYRSTIILDEPHAIPLRWWPAVERLLDVLVDDYDARVILMTATQPSLADDHDLTPLAEGINLDLPERVTYRLHASLGGEPIPTETAAASLVQDVTSEEGSTATISICNTIASVESVADDVVDQLRPEQHVSIHDLYEEQLDRTAAVVEVARPDMESLAESMLALDDETVITCPLTTHHRPCDRERILDALDMFLEARNEEANNSAPSLIAVTTQLVEAGVDVSFDTLYRDVGPYDSLVQAAGRCNRNYEQGVGEGVVTVWQLAPPDTQGTETPPSELIYTSQREIDSSVNKLAITRDILDHVHPDGLNAATTVDISESAITEQQPVYQSRLTDRRPSETSISRAIEECDGDRLRDAAVIHERPSISVVVPRTTALDKRIEAFETALAANDYDAADQHLQILRRAQVDLRPQDSGESITEVAREIDTDLYALRQEQVADKPVFGRHGCHHPRKSE